MKNKFFLLVLVLILILIAGVFLSTSSKKPIKTVTINHQTFEVEVADSPTEKEQGLMNRNSLLINKGMLFVYDKADIYTYWMKNTKIPLDIIWINNGRIVEIKTLDPEMNGVVPQYTPKEKANFVLEINAGLANFYGFKVGDSVMSTS